MIVVDTIESCLVKYLSSHPEGSVTRSSEATFIVSGSNASVMNYAIIKSVPAVEEIQATVDGQFNVNGFTLSYADDLETMSKVEGLKYLGRILVAISKGFSGERDHPEISVKRVDRNNINDYLRFLSENRSIEPHIMRSIINSNDSLYMYIAYKDGHPTGAGSAIRDGENIFIFDTIVREDQRNSGIFSAIVTQSMLDVSQEGEYMYYALVSSPASLSGALKGNFHKNMFMDLWMREAK